MIKKLRNIVIVLATFAAMALPAFAPAIASAQISDTPNIKDNVCGGTNLQFGQSGGCDNASVPTNKLNGLLAKVINIFSIIVGVIAVIMIIVGGLKYITSGGESSNISGAKNTIIFALIGLVIVALAQFIVHFVLGNVNQFS